MNEYITDLQLKRIIHDDWFWRLENGIAKLHEVGEMRPSYYNESSVRTALATVLSHRHEYATEEAWQKHVRKFEQGVALFN